jgi:hypothetical protein
MSQVNNNDPKDSQNLFPFQLFERISYTVQINYLIY